LHFVVSCRKVGGNPEGVVITDALANSPAGGGVTIVRGLVCLLRSYRAIGCN